MIEVNAKSILKVPGVKIENLTKVHALIDSLPTNNCGRGFIELLTSKYEAQTGTYTVEISMPLAGHYPERYDSSFKFTRCIPLKLFEALGIYPEPKM